MTRAYYNEIDPFAAAWLRALIDAGQIAPGDVDERSIADVRPDDLRGYAQCHFFAGLGAWAYALRLAGWADDRPVWTGSCPCQPFSVAGRGAGTNDARHLWPEFRRLIAESQIAVCFGEQVAGRAGRAWLASVRADLEDLGYAVGAADIPACSVGAPHIRQRLYWVADAGSSGQQRGGAGGGPEANRAILDVRATDSGYARRLADSRRDGIRGGGPGEAGNAPRGMQGADGQRERVRADVGAGGATVGRLADAEDAIGRGAIRAADTGRRAPQAGGSSIFDAWADAEYIACRDGKHRPVGAGLRPLAPGTPGRVGKLRGYGNCIVPQAAAAFVTAYMAAMDDTAH